MKKFLIIALTAIIALSSCQKNLESSNQEQALQIISENSSLGHGINEGFRSFAQIDSVANVRFSEAGKSSTQRSPEANRLNSYYLTLQAGKQMGSGFQTQIGVLDSIIGSGNKFFKFADTMVHTKKYAYSYFNNGFSEGNGVIAFPTLERSIVPKYGVPTQTSTSNPCLIFVHLGSELVGSYNIFTYFIQPSGYIPRAEAYLDIYYSKQ